MMTRLHFLTITTLGAIGMIGARCLPASASPERGLPSRIVIAQRNEPGERLVITGRAFGPDGKPRGGVEIYAYHTDATGVYRNDGVHVTWPATPPRLEGRLVTAADGSYEIDTIKPAAYPNRRDAAHIHFRLKANGVPDQSSALEFEGDPLLTPTELANSRGLGTFAEIRPLIRDARGVLRCTRDFRLSLKPRGDA